MGSRVASRSPWCLNRGIQPTTPMVNHSIAFIRCSLLGVTLWGLVPAPLACRSHVSVARFRFIPWHAAGLSGPHPTSISRGTQHQLGSQALQPEVHYWLGLGLVAWNVLKHQPPLSTSDSASWCLSHQSSKKNQVSRLSAVLPKHSDHQPNRRNTITHK